jgi:hypothetical protein
MAVVEEALALTLVALARASEATRFARHALEVRLARQGRDHPEVALALVALGRSRAGAGDARGADSALAAALALRERTLPAGHPLTCEAAAYLGLLRLRQGRTGEAGPLLAGAAPGLPAGVALRAEVEQAMQDGGPKAAVH